MKIKRQLLIETLQTRLDEREKLRLNRHTAAVNSYNAEERRYAESTHEAWKSFADRIHYVLGRGGLVTPEDIPKAISDGSLRGGLKFFRKGEPLPPTPTEEELLLRRLIEILKNSTDVEVSTYALEKMGFPLGRVLK